MNKKWKAGDLYVHFNEGTNIIDSDNVLAQK